jgi:Carboxypeptidase regulatory-like domain/TonB dependent receptor/TonB-dependent Receptor Plug Domain
MSLRFLLALTACCFSLSLVAAGQTRATTGDLGGTIVDQSSAVLPGATVTAQNVETNHVRSAMTDDRGHFLIPALPPGTYTVKAELQGFTPRTLEDVVVTLGSLIDVRLSLNVAGGQEVVLVAGEAPVIDTQRTAVSNVISQAQIEHLPINGRNFIGFSLLAPGVGTDRTPQQGASGTSGLTFAGQRARSNNITVDGLDNNDSSIGSVRATFSQEAVREFQVLTNSYSAEFGKASGGVVNIVTKSGTNTMAGNLFFFLRDGALNSKDHFERFNPADQPIEREKAPYSQKQFGATFGGPLKQDRTFYFLSFERLDIAAHNFVTIDNTNNVTFLGQNLGTPAAILERAGFQVETGHVPYDVRSNQFLAKLDHELNASNALTARINWANDFNENIEPFGGNVARSRGAVLESDDLMFALSHLRVGSAKMVNELRFQLASRDQTVNSLDPRCGGPCTLENQGGPTLEVLGVASVGRQRFTPQPRKNMRYQVLDTVSYFTGSHQFKAGFDFNFINASDQRLPLHFGGRYIFGSIPASSAPALGLPAVEVPAIVAVQLGVPGRYVQGYGDSEATYTYSDLSLFAQDDWRVTPRLTAKFGVRYQLQAWPDITYNVVGYPGPYSFPGDGNNIAPRLGLAWDVFGDRRTTIRGAYGLYYDNLITAVAGITKGINGSDRVRTLVAGVPTTVLAWNAPGRRLPQPASYPSLVISIDPVLQTPYAHHLAAGVERELPGSIALAADFIYVRGFKHPSTVDYNPLVPALGANRRPSDANGMPGTSASVLQYTSFGETWYRGFTVTASRRFLDRHQLLMSYTLSKAEDNATDFQSEFIPQDSGRGRNPDDIDGLPLAFDPNLEKGPSVQDQRHRFVASGIYVLPKAIELSSIITIGSGRPYNILAGVDLNGDGDGGATDRARTTLADISTSVHRNAGTLPAQATVDLRVSRRFPVGRIYIDGIFEVFNLFNRSNFIAVNNVFGTGSYPSSQAPTFGQFTQAAPPRQVQLAVKVGF